MSFQDILQWWNLIYAAPLLVSLVWIVATVLSGAHADGSHGGHVHSGHVDHGLGHSISHAAHQAGDTISHGLHHGHGGAHDAGHAHAGHDAHAHHHGGHNEDSLFSRLLLILGFGRVPITLIFGVFLLSWGAFGLVVNRILHDMMKIPALYIVPSVAITFISSAFFTRLSSAVIGKMMPGTETFGVSRFEMIGSIGRAVYPISENAGTINIKDTYGTVHRVQAKTEPGGEPIPAGTEVITVDFDEEDKRFVVRTSSF